MARRPLSERLAAERERMARLQDKVRKLEAQERRTERSRDTRRKVLLGALVMDELERDTGMANDLRRWLAERLPGYLQRETDQDVMARFMDGGAPAGSGGDLTEERSGDASTPPPPQPIPAGTMMAGDDPNGLSNVPDHADTFAALARLGVGDDVLASVRHYLDGVRSGDQFVFDPDVVPYLPPEHLERHLWDALDRVRKRPGMFRGDGPDGLREGARLLDEEAERVRGWLATVARRKDVGEPNLDAAMAAGEASVAGLGGLANEWQNEADRA